ncbi:pyruvate/2-oxoglutarate dehydrogenase complex, dihydrolipoamide dehydrogenase component [Xenococcus sp. PCC 7305]|uniref:glutathione-disulfide reductase n=1 Tax=Xenococcus sp. PCC 7305 TaxID=102125 RepID=UPI0002ABAD27|nr:glutathione-disulfide reductase [Xenococcus sp. PCC 7305]ELS04259.1 pyruvate/2-oxoglutarate dehydrogenase complex, dihydrolipoamide dehydrogenase component [Xenococcus sp. PCC 7305]
MDYDFLIIGAGTGGMAAAKKAASYGAKVALIEKEKVGGTCVNRGCTPKKLMVYAADFALKEPLAGSYAWQECNRQLDWSLLMKKIHTRLENINNSFKKTFAEKGIDLIYGEAKFTGKQSVKVKDREITADKILIAVGGHPIKPDFPGSDLAITSREMFQLERVPEKIAIVGGGYIGVEFASIMNAFGAEVVFMDTSKLILSGFDKTLRQEVQQGLINRGIEFIAETTAEKIESEEDKFKLYLDNDRNIIADKVLLATGRAPNTKNLDLDKADVETGDKEEIKVDEYYRTKNQHIYAVGDCIDRIPLTPIAKAEALAVVETLYGKKPQSIDYDYVASAVFSRPEAATVGMSESSARDKYGDQVQYYYNSTTSMLYSLADDAIQEQIVIKLVTVGIEEKIVGAHMVGEHAADMIQCLGVAIRQEITKDDLDNSFGIHPTIGEEFMSMY